MTKEELIQEGRRIISASFKSSKDPYGLGGTYDIVSNEEKEKLIEWNKQLHFYALNLNNSFTDEIESYVDSFLSNNNIISVKRINYIIELLENIK